MFVFSFFLTQLVEVKALNYGGKNTKWTTLLDNHLNMLRNCIHFIFLNHNRNILYFAFQKYEFEKVILEVKLFRKVAIILIVLSSSYSSSLAIMKSKQKTSGKRIK